MRWLGGASTLWPPIGEGQGDALALAVRVFETLGLVRAKITITTDHVREVMHQNVNIQTLCLLVGSHPGLQPQVCSTLNGICSCAALGLVVGVDSIIQKTPD